MGKDLKNCVERGSVLLNTVLVLTLLVLVLSVALP